MNLPALRVRSIVVQLISLVVEVRATASSSIIIILVSFGSSVLAARLLGPEHRGALAAAVVYVYLAAAVADGGLNQAVPYYAARHKPDAAAVLGTASVLAMGLGTAVAIAAYVLLAREEANTQGALYYLPSIPFGLLTTHLAAFMYGGGMLTQFNVMRVLQTALLLFAMIVAAIVKRPDVQVVLMIAVAFSVLLAVGAAVTIGRRVPVWQWTVDRQIAKGLLRYALRSYGGNLCWLFNSRLDQLMMSFLMSAASLGIYATAVSYAGVVFSFFGTFAMLAFAKASAIDAHEDAEVQHVIRRHLMMSLLTGVPAAVGLAGVAPWLYPSLFGADFAAGVPAAMILCVAGVFLGLNYTLSNGLRIRNQPLKPSMAEAVGVVVSIGGLLYVLPRRGIVGAALVSLVSYATVFCILVYFSRSRRVASPQPARSAL